MIGTLVATIIRRVLEAVALSVIVVEAYAAHRVCDLARLERLLRMSLLRQRGDLVLALGQVLWALNNHVLKGLLNIGIGSNALKRCAVTNVQRGTITGGWERPAFTSATEIHAVGCQTTSGCIWYSRHTRIPEGHLRAAVVGTAVGRDRDRDLFIRASRAWRGSRGGPYARHSCGGRWRRW